MELRHADPRMRRFAVALVAALAAIGAIAFVATQHWLDTMNPPPPAARSRLLMAFAVLMGTGVLVLQALAAYLFRYGKRVRETSMFPPPGARVVRDTPILRGAGAMRRGAVLQVIGAVCALGGIALALLAWRLLPLFPA